MQVGGAQGSPPRCPASAGPGAGLQLGEGQRRGHMPLPRLQPRLQPRPPRRPQLSQGSPASGQGSSAGTSSGLGGGSWGRGQPWVGLPLPQSHTHHPTHTRHRLPGRRGAGHLRLHLPWGPVPPPSGVVTPRAWGCAHLRGVDARVPSPDRGPHPNPAPWPRPASPVPSPHRQLRIPLPLPAADIRFPPRPSFPPGCAPPRPWACPAPPHLAAGEAAGGGRPCKGAALPGGNVPAPPGTRGSC